jgi:hypothetical protein
VLVGPRPKATDAEQLIHNAELIHRLSLRGVCLVVVSN